MQELHMNIDLYFEILLTNVSAARMLNDHRLYKVEIECHS